MTALQQFRSLAGRARTLLYRSVTPVERVLRGRDASIIPPAHLRLYYFGTLDTKRFESASRTAALELTSRGLKPDHRVLDIGAGLGNLAMGLVEYLRGGYDGIEIHGEASAWCRRAITSRYPAFRFHHADIVSRAYNAAGKVSSANYRFPFDDRTFDYVLLSSVFTHMLPDGVERYLHEIARVLVRGGVCVESYFLLNELSRSGVEQRRSFMSFDVSHPSGFCRLHSSRTPEAAVALDEDFVVRTHQTAGLRIQDIRRGGWWRGDAHDQDVVTAVRM